MSALQVETPDWMTVDLQIFTYAVGMFMLN
jgi:hypothetical protein